MEIEKIRDCHCESITDIIMSRRSIRSFLPDAIPDDKIEKILISASFAPSGGNSQNWYFVVIKSSSIKDKLLKVVADKVSEYTEKIQSPRGKREFNAYSRYFTFFKDAPVLVAVIKKPYESLLQRILRKHSLENEMSSYADIQGPSAAIQNMILAAHSLGVGSCWMTGPLIAKKEMEVIVGVDPQDELIALVPLGYPSHHPEVPKRKKIDEIASFL